MTQCNARGWLPFVVSFGWLGARSDLFLASFLFLLTPLFVSDIGYYIATANKEKSNG